MQPMFKDKSIEESLGYQWEQGAEIKDSLPPEISWMN